MIYYVYIISPSIFSWILPHQDITKNMWFVFVSISIIPEVFAQEPVTLKEAHATMQQAKARTWSQCFHGEILGTPKCQSISHFGLRDSWPPYKSLYLLVGLVLGWVLRFPWCWREIRMRQKTAWKEQAVSGRVRGSLASKNARITKKFKECRVLHRWVNYLNHVRCIIEEIFAVRACLF